jgi:cytochrome P450
MVNRFRGQRATWRLTKWLNVGDEARHTVAIKAIDAVAYRIVDDNIARHAAGGDENETLMRRMIPAATDAATGAVDRKLLRDMCVTLFVAGRDTTSATLLWLFYELAQHAAVEAAVVDEIAGAVGAQAPNFDNCAGLDYLQAVISETHRLHPPVPLSDRVAMRADTLPSGLRVAAGSTVVFSAYMMGRRADLWGADFAAFRPARWLDAGGRYRRESQYKAGAFSGGRRACVGMEMALFETKLVAVALLQRFAFALKPGCVVREKMSVVLTMQDDMVLLASRRA